MDSLFCELLKQDKRYPSEAYAFVFETLDFAQNVLQLGHVGKNEPLRQELRKEFPVDDGDESDLCNHIRGQDLCLAAKDYAQQQYGLLAPIVLRSMGIRSTGDIGEIVFNLIAIGHMRKTTDDRREDFDNVFDLRSVFDGTYRISTETKK